MPYGVAIAGGTVTYDADETYFGFTGSPALNQETISSGDAVAYVPWFDTDGYYGDLWAVPVSSSGQADLGSPLWRAGVVMDAAADADTSYWDDGRFIVTMS